MDTHERLQNIEENLNIITESLTELKMAICGSEKIGVEGIIRKVNKHEIYIENDKRQKWQIAGGVAVVSFIGGLIITLWDKLFK